MSSVLRRLQCRARRNSDLRGLKVRELGIYPWLHITVWRAVWHSRVSDVITGGEVEMLQSVEVLCCLRHTTIADSLAVAESQAGEAAAVLGY